MVRLFSIAKKLCFICVLSGIILPVAAQTTATSIPVRKPVAQVNLTSNEVYFAETYLADINRLETALGAISNRTVTLPSKDRLTILLNQIDSIMFNQYCEKEGIRVSDSEVNSRIAQVKAQFGARATDAALESSLRSQGVYSDIKTYFKQELLFAAYIRIKKPAEYKSATTMTSDDILKSFNEMKFNLRRPDVVRGSMLFASTQGMSAADKKKTQDAMTAIALKLKAKPGDFDKYMADGLVDPKAAGYNTLMNFTLARTTESKTQFPELYDVVFALKPSEVSALVEDARGFSIVRESALLPSTQLGLDDSIEGLPNPRAASIMQINPAATVFDLIAMEIQTTKTNNLMKSKRDEIMAQLRKDAQTTITIKNLEPILEAPEIAAIKKLETQNEYKIKIQ